MLSRVSSIWAFTKSHSDEEIAQFQSMKFRCRTGLRMLLICVPNSEHHLEMSRIYPDFSRVRDLGYKAHGHSQALEHGSCKPTSRPMWWQRVTPRKKHCVRSENGVRPDTPSTLHGSSFSLFNSHQRVDSGGKPPTSDLGLYRILRYIPIISPCSPCDVVLYPKFQNRSFLGSCSAWHIVSGVADSPGTWRETTLRCAWNVNVKKIYIYI